VLLQKGVCEYYSRLYEPALGTFRRARDYAEHFMQATERMETKQYLELAEKMIKVKII
jgi:hypothetical protein